MAKTSQCSPSSFLFFPGIKLDCISHLPFHWLTLCGSVLVNETWMKMICIASRSVCDNLPPQSSKSFASSAGLNEADPQSTYRSLSWRRPSASVGSFCVLHKAAQERTHPPWTHTVDFNISISVMIQEVNVSVLNHWDLFCSITKVVNVSLTRTWHFLFIDRRINILKEETLL